MYPEDREEIYDSPTEKANGSQLHFPASGRFLGTKNKIEKCTVLWCWTFKVNSYEFSAKRLYSHL